jgi:hypothetical protein
MIITDNQSESDVNKDNEGYLHDPSLSTQEHDDIGVQDYHDTEDIEDAPNSELVDQPKSQDSGPQHRELSSAPSTSSTRSSIMATEQQLNGDTLSENHVPIHGPQGPLNKEEEEHIVSARYGNRLVLSNSTKASSLTLEARVATATDLMAALTRTLAITEHHRRASGVYWTRRTVVTIPKYAMVMTAATTAAKAVTVAAVLKATSDKSQAHGPIARALAAERTRTMNMRWSRSSKPVSITQSCSTVSNGWDMRMIRRGTMHLTSRTALASSVSFTPPILPA